MVIDRLSVQSLMSEQIRGRIAILSCVPPITRSMDQQVELAVLQAELVQRSIPAHAAELQEREIVFKEGELRDIIRSINDGFAAHALVALEHRLSGCSPVRPA